MRVALNRSALIPGKLDSNLHNLNQELLDLNELLNGNHSKEEIGEISPPTVKSRLNNASYGSSSTLYGPTGTQKKNLEYAKKAYREIRSRMLDITDNRIPAMEKELISAGTPWIEGQPLPE